MIKSKSLRLLIVIIILLAVSPFAAWWLLRCYGPIAVKDDIGKFDSKESGLRAAIPHLVNQFRFCPCSEEYRIVWQGPDPEDKLIGGRALYYNRRSKLLGYEQDAFSGTTGKTYRVDQSAIQAVAEKGGTMDNFLVYDQTSK
jgi:hypothetical protein